MSHTLVTEYDGSQISLFLEYSDNTHFQIYYNDKYDMLADECYIYYLQNNTIYKIFDINKRMFINNKSIIDTVYNNYLNEQKILKKEKGLQLTS